MFMAFVTFLEQVLSLFQAKPRTHERYVPASRRVHDASKSISVLLVPSEMSGMRTPAGVGDGERLATTVGMNGRMPSAARPPWAALTVLTLYAGPVRGFVPTGPALPT